VRALGRLHDVDLLLERDVKLDRAPLQAKRDRRAARADRLLQSSRVRRALRADH
jgi:hypothetical protein